LVYSKNSFDENCYTLIKDKLIKSKGFSELRLIDLKIRDHSLIPRLLSDLKLDMRLSTLSLSKLKLDNMAAKILGEFISNNPYCLKNLDISWNHFSCQATSDLLKTFYGNEELKFLNVSHNRVTMTDQLKEFGLFVR